MTRRIYVFLWAVLSCVATVTAVAQTTPDINGRINGIEICWQEACGYAAFAGTFTGKIGSLGNTTAVFAVAVHHQSPLNEQNRGVTVVTDGTWYLLLSNQTTIEGTVNGGTLTYHAGNNTFDIDLTLTITEGGSGEVNFDGTLNHGTFPPTVTGRMRGSK